MNSLPRILNTERIWLLIAAALLASTAIAKMITVFGSAPILLEKDPVFHVVNRWLLVVVAIIEIAISIFCVFGRNSRLSGALLAGIGTSFALYRFELWWTDYSKPCTCLGDITSKLRISESTADYFLKGIIVYLLIIGYTLLLYRGPSEPPKRTFAAKL